MVMDEKLCAKVSLTDCLIWETYHLWTRPWGPRQRQDWDRDVPTSNRDRDVTKTLGKCISRPGLENGFEKT